MLTNTFHSSTGRHSIKDSASLTKVQNHNSRGNFSIEFDPTKIVDLIGHSSCILDDVKNAINEIFSPVFAQYNEMRKSKKLSPLNQTPFEYFAANKNLNIACEAILQLGHTYFWSNFRQDTGILIIDRVHVLKKYPEHIKDAMNSLYQKQAYAYEHIYETHGKLILQKINNAYAAAEKVLNKYNQSRPEFVEYSKMKRMDLACLLYASDEKTRVEYAEYAQALKTTNEIVKKRLRERIVAKEMHIQVICMTAHYDEYSPHAHIVNICYAGGYEQGLSTKVAKSIVLNRWTLEVIQDRLHEIAEQEMQAHPEIFKNHTLLPKEKGRNFNYTKEQIARRNIVKLLDRLQELENTVLEKQAEKHSIQEDIELTKEVALDAKQEYEEIMLSLNDAHAQLCDLIGNINLIESYSEYDYQEEEIEKSMNCLLHLLDSLHSASRLFKGKQAAHFIKEAKDDLHPIFGALTYWYSHLKNYEAKENLTESQRKTRTLDEKIFAASQRLQEVDTQHNLNMDEPAL